MSDYSTEQEAHGHWH